MKIKLQKIINAFNQRTPEDIPLLTKVSGSIKDFARKVKLIPAIKEIREIYEEYRKEENKIVKEVIEGYCKENKLAIDDVKRVPPSKMKEFTEETKKVLDTIIELNHTIKFTLKEIENSGIDINEMIILEDFFTLKKVSKLTYNKVIISD